MDLEIQQQIQSQTQLGIQENNVKQYIKSLEQAIVNKQQWIDIQRMRFLEIIKKFAEDAEQHDVQIQDFYNYIDNLNIVEDDFDQTLNRRKKNNNIIRIPKQEIQKILGSKPTEPSQQLTESQDQNQSQGQKQKRKYTKKKKSDDGQQEPTKRKRRRTKKEMEEARMQLLATQSQQQQSQQQNGQFQESQQNQQQYQIQSEQQSVQN